MKTFFLTNYSDQPKGRLCHETKLSSVLPIRLFQRGKDNFTVQYGNRVKSELTYSEAASEYGTAIMHGLECDGLLDKREKLAVLNGDK